MIGPPTSSNNASTITSTGGVNDGAHGGLGNASLEGGVDGGVRKASLVGVVGGNALCGVGGGEEGCSDSGTAGGGGVSPSGATLRHRCRPQSQTRALTPHPDSTHATSEHTQLQR